LFAFALVANHATASDKVIALFELDSTSTIN
jgi:hypothetical protein